jgi:hypothetical protein
MLFVIKNFSVTDFLVNKCQKYENKQVIVRLNYAKKLFCSV